MSLAAQQIDQPAPMLLEMPGDKHRVGPNAIIQTSRALEKLCGREARDAIFAAAGFGWMQEREPTDMVRAEAVVALNRAIHDNVERQHAERIMWHAGVGTARYILANRIPKPAQYALSRLPRGLAAHILLKAIGKNAWTFAGAAKIQVGRNWIAIEENPICLGRSGFSSCVWHQAVFTTLFEDIIGGDVIVQETHCIARGDKLCRFEIEVGSR